MESTVDQLSSKLKASEVALFRAELLAAVADHAAQAMCDASNPLEILTNLHYLTRHSCEDPAQVIAYMELAELQAAQLLKIISRVIRLHRAAKESDERFVV